MSRDIDNKVVEMRFDNSKFDSKIKDSLQSLTNLKNSISGLDKSAKSLKNIESAASSLNINTSGIVGAVDSIADRFTNLGIIGMRVLQNLTDKAVNFGINFVKSVSIDQVMEGFSKYTAETNAVQTIWSATKDEGESLDHIYEVLGGILDYTDRTSYHYDSMVSTISKFVNSGVKLEDASLAVQGIANWAAYSGAGIQKADYAMNALINAMSQGYVSAREWMTILKTADMGTKQFKQLVIDTGEEMGILAKNEITLENFAQDLGNGKWFTSELLLEVLQRYGDETTQLGKDSLAAASEAKTFAEAVGAVKDAVSTGWKVTFNELFGRYDEAKKWWTSLQDAMLEIFTLGMNHRNEILHQWHEDLDGYRTLMDALHNFWIGLKNIAAPIGEVWKNMFPAITAENLKTFTDRLHNLTATFANLFDVTDAEILKPGKQKENLAYLEETDGHLTRVSEAMKRVARLKGIVRGFFSVIDVGKKFLSALWNEIKIVSGWLSPLGNTFLKVVDAIARWTTGIDESVTTGDKFTAFFEKVNTVVGPVVEKLVGWIDKAVDKIIEFAETTHIFSDLKELFTGVKNVIVDFCKQHFTFPSLDGLEEFSFEAIDLLKPIETVFNILGKIFEGIKAAVEFIKPVISDFIDFVVEKAKGLSDDGTFFGFIRGLIGSGILAGIGAWVWDLSNVVRNVNWALGGIADAAAGFGKKVRLGNFKTIATSVLMLAGAMLILASIDSEKLLSAGAALTIILGELVGAAALFSEIGKKDKRLFGSSTGKAVKGLITISAAVLILTFALKNLAGIDLASLAKGVGAIGILMAELAGFVKLMGGGKMAIGTGLGLMFTAVAVRVLVGAVEKLGKMDIKTLVKGLGAVFFALLSLSAVIGMGDGAKRMFGVGLGLVLVATSLLILQNAVEKFGKMEFDTILKGMGAMFAALLMMTGVLKILSKSGAFGAGLGILIVAASLEIIADVADKFRKMSWEGLGKAGAAIGASLIAIALALHFMKGTLPAAIALLVASAALAAFAVSIRLISKVDSDKVGTSLAVIAVGLLTLLGAASVAGKLIGGLIALGIGLVLFAVGLTAMYLPLKLLSTLRLEDTAKALVAIIAGFAAALAASAIGSAAAPGMLAASAAIVVFAASLALFALGMRLIIEVFKSVSWADIGKAAAVMAGGLVLLAGAALLGTALAPGLVAFAVGITAVGVGLAVLGAGLLVLNLGLEAAIEMVGNFVAYLKEHGPEILENIKSTLKNAVESVKQKAKDFAAGAIELMTSFIDGVKAKKDEIIDSVKTTINTAWAALKQKVTDWYNIGKDLLQGLIDGIVEKGTNLKDKVTSTVDSAVQAVKDLLGIKSPSKIFAEIGKFSMLGLIKGFDDNEKAVDKKAEEVAKSAYERFKKAIENAANLAQSQVNTTPTITPIVDLSNVKKSAQSINGMLSASSAVKATGTIAAYTDTATSKSAGLYGNQNKSGSSVTYNFNQTNVSPSPLNRTEIYRQTSNQFAAFKSTTINSGGGKNVQMAR